MVMSPPDPATPPAAPKLSPPFELLVPPDKMTVYLTLRAAGENGPAAATAEQILAALAEQKIVFGIDEAAIKKAVARVAAEGNDLDHLRIAGGQEPVPGSDGRLELKFGLKAANHDSLASEMVGPGRVMAVKIPPGPGTPGRDVYGAEIAPTAGAESPASAGEHVAFEPDSGEFRAEIYGRAIIADGALKVENPVVIAEDRMSARLLLCPRLADNSALTWEEALATLKAAGVEHGIREEALRAALAGEQSLPDFEAAIGAPPTPGVDARLDLRFPTETPPDTPLPLVEPGDILAVKIPARPGVEGRTVKDEPIPAPPPQEVTANLGENVTIQPDGLTFVMTDELPAGYPQYRDGSIAVLSPLRLSEDGMEARLDIHPPVAGGKELSEEAVLRLLQHFQVTHGVNPQAIRQAMSRAAADGKPRLDVLIAHGIPPVRGEDAMIESYLPTGKRAGRIVSEATDQIDFRERDLIANVRQGQVLMVKIPAEAGRDGRDILGRELPAEPGADHPFAPLDNVELSRDGLAMLSTIDGMVMAVEPGKLKVLPIFEISGDVDYTTGNLEMAGTLIIKGWVRTGFTVKASGDIRVGGGVEAAVLEAGGNVLINGGVMGSKILIDEEEMAGKPRTTTGGDLVPDEGRIKAGGDLNAHFLEQTRVRAGGNVVVRDQIMRSTVAAAGIIQAVAGKGRIRGGATCALQGIEANEAGSEAGVPTMLMAGVDLLRQRRLLALQRQLNGYRRERAKLDTILARHLGRGRPADLPRETARKLSLVGKRRRSVIQAEERLAEPLAKMEQELAGIDLATVKIVLKKGVYANTTIIIGKSKHLVTDDLPKPVTFILGEDGRITSR